jgi:hypothetical protein
MTITWGGRRGGKAWRMFVRLWRDGEPTKAPAPIIEDKHLHDHLLPAIIRNCLEIKPGRHMPGTYELALAAGRKAITDGRPWDAHREAMDVIDARDMTKLCLCGHFHPPAEMRHG